ncbi:MAG: group 1 truncated hemoglobin [Hymenobacteraceae bacterium]|nr:group 1 truncated hemoglobin [Hymenobacteraceae bacterium]
MLNVTRRLCTALLVVSVLVSAAACTKKDADPAPTPAPEVTLYERLGRVDGISKIVDKFMANVGAETQLPNSILLRSHLDFLTAVNGGNDFRRLVFRNNLIDQLGSDAVSGGPLAYKGKSMVETHRGMNITNQEFDEVAHQLDLTLDFYNIPAADKTALLYILGNMRGSIVGH